VRDIKLSVAALAVLVMAAAAPAAVDQAVTTAAVWHPAAGFVADFHKRCDGYRGTAFDACFAAAMAQSGASSAALTFTKRLDNKAYLQALVPTGGPVAIAHAFYPFRANENDAWLLVNGTPQLIDVDDRRYLPLAQMRSSPAYRDIRRHYPNVTFWAGDRGRSGPEVLENGREIIVGYLLRDLCHACAIVGRVRYAFDFDADGKFLGTRLVSITPATKDHLGRLR
jgi:hypothetical protein